MFTAVWGIEMVAVDAVSWLIGFVLGVTAVVGATAGMPLMFARRRHPSSRIAPVGPTA